jgi:hypothetical protein
MTCVRFLAPTILQTLGRNDVIIIQNFSGQIAGGPTNCFRGERPIYLAKLFRKGSKRSTIIEFIPLNRKMLKTGLKLTKFVSLGVCTLGPEPVPKFNGTLVSCACRCYIRPKKLKTVKKR